MLYCEQCSTNWVFHQSTLQYAFLYFALLSVGAKGCLFSPHIRFPGPIPVLCTREHGNEAGYMCKFTHLPMFSVFNIKQITWKLGRAEYKVKARLLAIPTTSLFPCNH